MLFIGLQLCYTQAPDWSRVLQFNTFDLQYGRVVTTDASNVYMAGSISGPITFDGTSFTSVGARDMIIVKLSNTGVTTWVKQINAQVNGLITAKAIKVDTNQNLYVSGTFTGTTTIGSSTITSGTLYNEFIAKFDVDGNGVWATAYLAAGTGSSKIALDNNGNSYLISSSSKLFKFDNSGIKQWEQNYTDQTLQAIAVYDSNLYIGGALPYGTTTFGTITLTSGTTLNTGFLVKATLDGVYYDSIVEGGLPLSTKEGNYQAVGYFYHPTAPRAINLIKAVYGMEEDKLFTFVGDLTTYTGSLIFIINGDSTISYDPSSNINGNIVTAIPDSVNYYDPLEHKFYLNYQYSMYGTPRLISEVLTLVETTGASGNGTSIADITFDNAGNLLIAGGSTNFLTLDTVSLINTVPSTYIAKCDTSFNFLWAKQSSKLNPSTLTNFSIYSDNFDNIYEVGYSTLNEPISYGSVTVHNLPGSSFLFKFDSNGNAINGYSINSPSKNGTMISIEGKILSTGSYDISGEIFYGNLFINQYNGENLEWRKISTNTQSGTAIVNYVKHDSSGNTYVKSSVSGYCNYFGTIINSNSNSSVTVIAKHDITGNLLWVNQVVDLKPNSLGSPSFGPGFTLDKDNNVLTVGRFETSLNIGDQTFINQNTFNDGYVAKYNSNGQFAWAVQLNADGWDCTLDGITADSEGNVIVSGEFTSEITISGNTISAGTNYGVFIIKFDANGNYIWAHGFPIGELVYLAMVSADENNNIYLAGEMYNRTTNLLTFGTVSTPQTNEDGGTVLVKFDADGNPQWANTYGGVVGASGADGWPVDIKTDATGNTYLWGWCRNNAVFGTTTLTNPFDHKWSYYLTKINTAGDVVWANAVYEKNYSVNYGDLLDLDKTGNIYVGGHFRDSISIAGTIYIPDGLNDFFVARYSNNGGFQWIKTIPADVRPINAISVFNDNILTLGGSSGKNSTLGNFDIIRKGGSSCIIATLGNLPFLTVSADTLTIEAAASSTTTFDISSNVSWTAESNQSWLTVNSSSGSDDETITLTATANPTTSPRTATVTVSENRVPPQTIIVIQDSAAPVLTVSTNTLAIAAADSSTATFDINSNINWTAESNQSWLIVSNSAGFGDETITLTATANTTISSRTATVTVSGNGVSTQTIVVTQDGAAPVLTVSTDTLTIAATDSSIVTFDITTNISWIAIGNQSWLTVSSSAGSGDETITLTATANPTIISRTASVTVYGTGVTEQIITIVQDAAIPVLTVSTNTLTITATDPITVTFDITSNISWAAESNQNWLTVSSSAGSGNETITLTATTNPITSSRTAIVTVSGTGVTEQIITVVQDGAIPVLMVSTNTLTIAAADSSTATFDISSNISWIELSNQSWLTMSSSAGSGNETITLTATANPTISSRTAIITVYGTGVTEQIITVVQDSAAPVLTVSTNTLTIAATDSTSATFDIASNISWTAESNQNWLTISSSAGSENETITLTATANSITSSRTATITVSGNGVSEQIITVVQDASTSVLMVSTNTLTIAAADSSNVTFDISSNISWIAISDQSWLTVSSSVGSGDETIILTATANSITSQRTATVTVYGTGVTEQIITIVQDAAISILTVSTNTLTIAATDNSTATFDINSNISWTAESNQSWLTVGIGAGFGNETITLTATANPIISSRTAIVTVYGTGVTEQIIIVIQNAAISVLTVSANTLTIAATDSTSATFEISSNISWIAISNQIWLTVSSSAGSGDETITLTATSNPTTDLRTATVTVYGTGVTEQTVTVTQNGIITRINEIINNYNVNLYPNPNNGKFNLDLDNFNSNDIINITIINSLGIVIKKFELTKISANYTQEIDLGNLVKSLYFMTLQTNKTWAVKSFVVQ